MSSRRRNPSPVADEQANDLLSSLPVKASGNRGRLIFLLLTASSAIMFDLCRDSRFFRNNHKVNSTAAKEVVSIRSKDGATLDRTKEIEGSAKEMATKRSKDASLKTVTLEHWTAKMNTRVSDHWTVKQTDENLEPSNIPVYLSHSNSSVAAIDYRFLASMWDRETAFDDLFLQAQKFPYYASSNTSSPSKAALQKSLNGRNITVIFHTSPKTASSTIRKACMDTQYDSCNLPRKPEGMTWPEGYRTPKRLVQLFEICPETRHFCVRYHPLTRNYTQFWDTRTFLHMFPFRNYNEWAVSALHQISFREGEEGCQKMEELLDECAPHKFELDFDKYSKTLLANFIVSMKRIRRIVSNGKVRDHHYILLHDYHDLHKILTWLSGKDFGVPSLPGTDQRINSVRPVESCKEEGRIMKKFHSCFSDKLSKLH